MRLPGGALTGLAGNRIMQNRCLLLLANYACDGFTTPV